MDQLLAYPEFPHLLSILIFLPLFGIVPLLLVNNDTFSRNWTLLLTSIVAILSIRLITGFDTATTQFQFAENHIWIE